MKDFNSILNSYPIDAARWVQVKKYPIWAKRSIKERVDFKFFAPSLDSHIQNAQIDGEAFGYLHDDRLHIGLGYNNSNPDIIEAFLSNVFGLHIKIVSTELLKGIVVNRYRSKKREFNIDTCELTGRYFNYHASTNVVSGDAFTALTVKREDEIAYTQLRQTIWDNISSFLRLNAFKEIRPYTNYDINKLKQEPDSISLLTGVLSRLQDFSKEAGNILKAMKEEIGTEDMMNRLHELYNQYMEAMRYKNIKQLNPEMTYESLFERDKTTFLKHIADIKAMLHC